MDKGIYNAAQLAEYIRKTGFLPLLSSGVEGFSAEEVVDEDCRYVVFPDGGWDWPLWKWKGPIVTDGSCVYGKFFDKKAGFISREWWPDFFNYRRSIHPVPKEGSIEEAILITLQAHGSLIILCNDAFAMSRTMRLNMLQSLIYRIHHTNAQVV